MSKPVEIITRYERGRGTEYSLDGGKTYITKAEFEAKSTKSQTDNTHHHHLVAGACVVPNCKDFPQPKTDNTEPTTSELGEILKNLVEQAFYAGVEAQDENPTIEVDMDVTKLVQTLEKKARIDEINSWFDLPKHYPGEEYRDEPFAKVKCKLPNKIQYYTLDNGFTYALKVRLNELSAGATAESPNNTTTRSKA